MTKEALPNSKEDEQILMQRIGQALKLFVPSKYDEDDAHAPVELKQYVDSVSWVPSGNSCAIIRTTSGEVVLVAEGVKEMCSDERKVFLVCSIPHLRFGIHEVWGPKKIKQDFTTQKWVKKYVTPEMMPVDQDTSRDFAKSTGKTLFDELTKLMQNPEEISKAVMSDLRDYNKNRAELAEKKKTKDKDAVVHKSGLLESTRTRPFTVVLDRLERSSKHVSDDLKSHRENKKKEAAEKKKEERKSDPQEQLKAQQKDALKNKRPLAMNDSNQEVSDVSVQKNSLLPFKFTLPDAAKKLLEGSVLKKVVDQYPVKAAGRPEFEKDKKVSARLVPPAVPNAPINEFITALKDAWPSGVEEGKQWGKQWGTHCGKQCGKHWGKQWGQQCGKQWSKQWDKQWGKQ